MLLLQVVFFGLNIVTPLISLELLKYPKLCHDYFSLLSHILEVYPETLPQLNSEALAHIMGTLDFGLHHQDLEVVNMCLGALKALAAYNYREICAGKTGLVSAGQGNLQEGIFSRFLRSLLQLLRFEDYSPDLVSAAADALLPLILCEQGLYQKLGNELIERQTNPAIKSRLANALHSLTSSNHLSSGLDRVNYQRFRKNLNSFLIEAGLKKKLPISRILSMIVDILKNLLIENRWGQNSITEDTDCRFGRTRGMNDWFRFLWSLSELQQGRWRHYLWFAMKIEVCSD
ncbi:hypothetical protein F3Y22_tig00112402pilonHSYRG00128 [Hibiscus syriacus]|uniref:Exportin-4 n=1 Tax=Hibiscus syriacus TaxID=106335 RepID=A0A6A2XD75_HIBSY|nr:hypothetical protein F3Y22_tig00112402pilonHSYRG00128 [Hibiscus syriacus]